MWQLQSGVGVTGEPGQLPFQKADTGDLGTELYLWRETQPYVLRKALPHGLRVPEHCFIGCLWIVIGGWEVACCIVLR